MLKVCWSVRCPCVHLYWHIVRHGAVTVRIFDIAPRVLSVHRDHHVDTRPICPAHLAVTPNAWTALSGFSPRPPHQMLPAPPVLWQCPKQCPAKPKGSICLLVKLADTSLWLCRALNHRASVRSVFCCLCVLCLRKAIKAINSQN